MIDRAVTSSIRWALAGGKPQACRVLEAAANAGMPPAMVVMELNLPPDDQDEIRTISHHRKIQVAEISNYDEISRIIENLDLAITCRFGILPRRVFNAPRLGCLNVHSSLLPRYRGIHPVPWALIDGAKVTGVSLHRIDGKVDHGALIGQSTVKINDADDIWSLTRKLDQVSGHLVVKCLRHLYKTGRLPVERPQHGEGSYARRLNSRDSEIDWNEPAYRVYGFTRVTRPPIPPSFTRDTTGQTYRVLECWLAKFGEADAYGDTDPGLVLAIDINGRSLVACGIGCVWVKFAPPPVTGIVLGPSPEGSRDSANQKEQVQNS